MIPKLLVLILTGASDEPYHHWQETTAVIRQQLEATGRFTVRVNEEPRGLTPAALQGYDAVIINYNGPRWPAEAERAVEQFVASGKGLAAFHLASYGPFHGTVIENGKFVQKPDRWQAFPKMTGAEWAPADIGHARRGVFSVDWRTPPGRKFTANDELYHKLKLSPGAEILADAMSETTAGGTGKREPLIWTNKYGKGRVFYTTLGHDTMAFYQPGMRDAFVRGVEWAASGAITIPESDPHKPAAGLTRLLLVTGGHSYPTAIYAMLDSLPGVTWAHAASPEEAFSRPLQDRYDAILLHDMRNETSQRTRDTLRAFVEAGKGVISLHHSVVDYTDWPWWWQQVTGTKYFEKAVEGYPASHYKEGIEFLVTPAKGKQNHPVLQGVGPLLVHDEAYRSQWHAPGIEVLMESAHELSDRPVVFIGPNKQARVLTITIGHSAHTMANPGFRKLIANAVSWTARRKD